MRNILTALFCAGIGFCVAFGDGAGSASENSQNLSENLSENAQNLSKFGVKFDPNSRTLTLNNGIKMPIYGIGMYSLSDKEAEKSILTALSHGVRLIDTATIYGNERGVGEGVRRGVSELGIARSEIFVITKLYPSEFGRAREAMESSFARLGLDYVDMVLLHHPGNGDVQAYQELESFVKAGKIRSLGLSNFYIKEYDAFAAQVSIPPALVQNEMHPYYQDSDVLAHLQGAGVAVQAWYPLGGRGHQRELLSDSVLQKIAAKHGKSVAQVILRWHLQRGTVVIPGSKNPAHIKENAEIFDFELSADEMAQIAALERKEKHDWY